MEIKEIAHNFNPIVDEYKYEEVGCGGCRNTRFWGCCDNCVETCIEEGGNKMKYAVVDKMDRNGKVTLYILENEDIEKFIRGNNMTKISEDHELGCWFSETKKGGDTYLDEFTSLKEARDWVNFRRNNMTGMNVEDAKDWVMLSKYAKRYRNL